MIIEQTTIYIALLTLSALIILIVSLIFAYINLMQKYYSIRKKKDTGIEDFGDAYKSVQLKLDKIVETAQLKAQNIIKSSEDISNQYAGYTKDELSKSMHSYVNIFYKSLQNLESDASKSIAEVPKEFRDLLSSQIEKLSQDYQKNLSTATQGFQEALKKSFMNVELEMQKYKEERIKEVDASIVEIIQNIARRVLMKEITSEEHEKIVMKALEDAKKQGIFSDESH